MPESNQMFGKSSGDTPDFFYILARALQHLLYKHNFRYVKSNEKYAMHSLKKLHRCLVAAF